MAIGGLNGFVSTEVLNSTFVLRINSSAKNPAHRQASNVGGNPLARQSKLNYMTSTKFSLTFLIILSNIYCYCQEVSDVNIYYKKSLAKYVDERFKENDKIVRLKTMAKNYIEIINANEFPFQESHNSNTERFALIHYNLNEDSIELKHRKYREIKFIGFEKSNITFLDLSNNALSKFPDGLCDMTKLKHLEFGSCSFENIPDDISNLKSLEVLLLNHTPIKSFPKSFSSLKKLKRIRVNYSSLVNKDEFLDILLNLPNLEVIELWSVGHSDSLPTSFPKLKKLKEVSLLGSYFNLQFIFSHSGIEKLSIDLTSVSEIPNSIQNLKNLKSLSIKGSMELTQIPIQLKELKNISEFSLVKNIKYDTNRINEDEVFEIIASWNKLERLTLDNKFDKIYPFYKSKKLSYFKYRGYFKDMLTEEQLRQINQKLTLDFGDKLYKCLELNKINPNIECER